VVISVDIGEATLVDIMATIMVDAIMAGFIRGTLTIGAACVLLLIEVIIVVGVIVGRDSIWDGHIGDGHIGDGHIGDGHIGDGLITILATGDGPIPITPIIRKLFPRRIANLNSSNLIIGTSVRTHRVTTPMSRSVRVVG
jgi:hypothetical protein